MVINIGLIATQLRCLDQRVVTLDNSSFERCVNHTKPQSGRLSPLEISHRCRDLQGTLDVINDELDRFAADSHCCGKLLAPPLMHGVRRASLLGIHCGGTPHHPPWRAVGSGEGAATPHGEPALPGGNV